MPRRSSRHALTTIEVPALVYRDACEAAREAIAGHVHQLGGFYHGNIWELAIACYFQGLQDATHMRQEYPGWPDTTLQPEEAGDKTAGAC